jgi:hypothetical protein
VEGDHDSTADVLRNLRGENSAAELDNLLATVVGAGEFIVLFLSLINVVVCAVFCFLFRTGISLSFGEPRQWPNIMISIMVTREQKSKSASNGNPVPSISQPAAHTQQARS